MLTSSFELFSAPEALLRGADCDCSSWHKHSHHEGCADERGQCGHAMNCPMFKRWIRESDPL